MQKYTPPNFPEGIHTAFHCPYCGAYADQTFWNLHGYIDNYDERSIDTLKASQCASCDRYAIWDVSTQQMLFPNLLAPVPHDEMPADIAIDYEEARQIVSLSPRGAAALLRLCVQKLMPHLGEKGKHIDTDIASLVQKGLPVKIQQSLDALRVIGNNAVHPGQIDLKDDRETAMSLFGLINFIVEKQIAEPKQIAAIYNNLPQSSRDAIKKRDGTT